MPPLVLASLPPPDLLKDSETTKDIYHLHIYTRAATINHTFQASNTSAPIRAGGLLVESST